MGTVTESIFKLINGFTNIPQFKNIHFIIFQGIISFFNLVNIDSEIILEQFPIVYRNLCTK